MAIESTEITPIAYVINAIGAIMGLLWGLFVVFMPQKANKYFSKNDILLVSTPEDPWWQRYFVLFRIVGAISMILSVAAIVSTVSHLIN